MGLTSTSRKRTTANPGKKASKPAATPVKKSVRPNSSILNFFPKAEKEADSLFIGRSNAILSTKPVVPDEDLYGAGDIEGSEPRFNESGTPLKRRRLSHGHDGEDKENDSSSVGSENGDRQQGSAEMQTGKKKLGKRKGPFIDDSESEDDGVEVDRSSCKPPSPLTGELKQSPAPSPPLKTEFESTEINISVGKETSCHLLPFNKDESVDSAFANVDGFADMDDFPDDEELGGEEYRMMRFMEEQARMEAEVEAENSLDSNAVAPGEAIVANCPICDGSLAGITTDAASKHVNACLDGNPIPLPQPRSKPEIKIDPKMELAKTSPLPTLNAPEMSKRFARAAVPRDGQANPFETQNIAKEKTGSAFAQLMSGHAESAAWANAAAAEHASRGKPAYERTCPFYKIMPNLSICVDAFRYGAVKGCNAYFLSHFHSDHYIGLTANWTHGPIYCSKVTGDLCKMQLRVAAKWVVALEFEETVEVPGTDGVTVTMIPANHCPGSSLFLFEKMLGKGPNAKKQRILHCGDFRACPAHVTHPLLKPNVRDAITGRFNQQKIDICYLDTTYLNPRYSFPPQDDVIQACAKLCASISPDPNAANDAWDRMTRKSGTESVSKYFTSLKQETSKVGESDDASIRDPPRSATDAFFANVKDKKPPPCRQRLLVICGTYSIGKERICIAIAKALKTKIFASPAKIRICSKLGDPELSALMTSDPLEAQVHMQMLMEIRAETLQDYLDSYRPHFSRIIGFRPSGWNYRPATSTGPSYGTGGSKGAGGLGGGPMVAVNANTSPSTVPTTSILHSQAWASKFHASDMAPQRGSTKDAMCFGVPYSEHSSFRELAMFVMALRIERVVPTVNVGSEMSRKRMKGWVDRWLSERRKGGLLHAFVEGTEHGHPETPKEGVVLWDGKDGKGGGAWW